MAERQGPGLSRPSSGTAERQELDELKARVDLAELVRQSGVELRRTGKKPGGPVPFS